MAKTTVATPICSHSITLSHAQLFCKVGEIGGQAYLLSRYNAIAYSTAPRGQGNWWQGLPRTAALTVERCYSLNCSGGSGKVYGEAYLLLPYNAIAHSIVLRGWQNQWQGLIALIVQCFCIFNCLRGRQNQWQSLSALTIHCYPIFNCSARSEKLVARLTCNCCSHGTMLSHTQLLCRVRNVDGKAHLQLLLSWYNAIAYLLNYFAKFKNLVARSICTLAWGTHFSHSL